MNFGMFVSSTGSPTPIAGDIRYNPTTCRTEIFDGSQWLTFTNQQEPSHGLSLKEEELAIEKMKIFVEACQLATKHPVLRHAIAALTEAEDNLRLVVDLCKNLEY